MAEGEGECRTARQEGECQGASIKVPSPSPALRDNLQVLYPGAADEPGQERDAAGTVLGGGRTGGGFAGSILGHQHGELASGTGT